VRSLEKQLARIVRKSILKLLKDVEAPLHIDVDALEDYLGKPVFQKGTARISMSCRSIFAMG
jgi:ATP-dependent Lon protease